MPLAIEILKNHPDYKDAGSDEEQDYTADDELSAISEELIAAVHAKDAEGTAQALKAAFACMEKAPHEEASHGEEME